MCVQMWSNVLYTCCMLVDEMNFCAVDVETKFARQLVTRMGYQILPEVGALATHDVNITFIILFQDRPMSLIKYDIVMLDVGLHRAALFAFHCLAREELDSTSCPGVGQLSETGKYNQCVCLLVTLLCSR